MTKFKISKLNNELVNESFICMTGIYYPPVNSIPIWRYFPDIYTLFIKYIFQKKADKISKSNSETTLEYMANQKSPYMKNFHLFLMGKSF